MKRLAIFIAGLTLSAACLAAPRMTPGLWEMTSSMEGAGMPQMPPTKFQHCYRPEDVKDLRRTIPDKNKDCQVSDWKESGNTVTWKMSCTGKTPMTSTGRITYAGDRYEGVNQITMAHGGQSMTMTQKYVARRLGDCR